MSQEYIRKKAREIFCQYATNDPVQIAHDLDIGIKYADIGALKGLYTIVLDKPFIVVNQNLSEAEQQIVLAHELGHHLLHQHFVQADGLRETVLYDMSSKPEYEANVFASQILLPDDEILDHIYNGYDAEQISRIMNTDINLVALKCAQLNQSGHKFNTPSYSSNFLNK